MGNPAAIITAQLHEENFRIRFVYNPRWDNVWKEVTRYILNNFIPESSGVFNLRGGYYDITKKYAIYYNINAVDIFSVIDKYARDMSQ